MHIVDKIANTIPIFSELVNFSLYTRILIMLTNIIDPVFHIAFAIPNLPNLSISRNVNATTTYVKTPMIVHNGFLIDSFKKLIANDSKMITKKLRCKI